MKNELIVAAFDQGARGYRQGLRPDQNPYNPAPGSQSVVLHGAWDSGWREQEKKSAER